MGKKLKISFSLKLRLALTVTPIIIMSLFLISCPPAGPAADGADPNESARSADRSTDYSANTLSAEKLRAATPINHNFNADNPAAPNPYAALSVPTYVTKIGAEYFIVDCYHNQVIYHDNLTDPLSAWSVMTGDLNMGHTVAGDGRVYLLDDTENNRILIMERRLNRQNQPVFVPIGEFTGIGRRPHYIVYDPNTATFYAWSSMTGEMYLFCRDPDGTAVRLTGIRAIPALMDVYVRSFTIVGDEIYFVSGNASIIRAERDSFRIIEEYPVPPQLAGMIQITLIEDYFYITVSTDAAGNQDYATLIRTADLSSLPDGGYEDVYAHFIGGGTPYSITPIEDRWYLTEHRLPGHSVWSFRVIDNEITDVISVY